MIAVVVSVVTRLGWRRGREDDPAPREDDPAPPEDDPAPRTEGHP